MFDALSAVTCVILFKIVFYYSIVDHKSYEVFISSPAVVS